MGFPTADLVPLAPRPFLGVAVPFPLLKAWHRGQLADADLVAAAAAPRGPVGLWVASLENRRGLVQLWHSWRRRLATVDAIAFRAVTSHSRLIADRLGAVGGAQDGPGEMRFWVPAPFGGVLGYRPPLESFALGHARA